jgi:hypothetical protein
MKSTKLPLLLFVLFIATRSFSQDFNIDVEHFVWSDSLPTFTPSEEDQKSATIIAFMNKITEYKWDKKGENIERFYLSHTLKYINDDKSIEDNNKIYVSTYDEQNLLYIRTRVINNGKVVFEASQKDFIEIEEEGHKYNQIALKQLTKGSLVETIIGYKLEMYLYSEEFFQTNYPVKKGLYVLVTPKELKFNSKVYNGTDTLTDSVYENRRFSYVTFTNVLPIDREESYSLVNANKLRVEYVYSQHMVTNYKYQKWPEMGRIFFDRMNKNYDKNQKDLDKILKKINLKQYPSEREKIFAIENFIKQNISSEDNAPEVESYSDVLKMKYTYPFKLNQIFFQLYRRAGINCEIVLTCAKDYKRFDPDFDSWAYLKSALLYFPSVKQFVDPQASLFRLGRINSDFLGQDGLFVKTITIGDMVSASASVKSIPGNAPESSSDFENYTVTLSGDLSSTTLDYNRKMFGYGDLGYRGLYYIIEEDKRKELMEEFVKGLATESTVSNLTIQNFNITEFKTLDAPFDISAKLTSNHYIEMAGEDKILLKVGELIGQQMEMYQESKRTNPVDITYAHNYNRTLTINIPKGYHLKGLEKLIIQHRFDNAAGKPSFGFVSSYKVEGDQLIITCKEYYNDLTYPVSQFEQFKEVINDAADFNKISILIEKDI